MVAVGYRFVPAAGAMLMRAIVRRALMTVRASVGVRACDGDFFVFFVLLCPHRESSCSPKRSIREGVRLE